MSSRARKSRRLTNHHEPDCSDESSSNAHVVEQEHCSTTSSTMAKGDLKDSGFAAIGSLELLQFDPRPTVVLDIQPTSHASLELIYSNPALENLDGLKSEFTTRSSPESLQDTERISFQSWAGSADSKNLMAYRGYLWSSFTIQKRWKVISSSPTSSSNSILFKNLPSPPSLEEKQLTLNPIESLSNVVALGKEASGIEDLDMPDADSHSVSSGSSTLATPDWTVRDPKGELSQHVQFARSIDWSKTSLGAMETWSREFRQLANKLMSDPQPAAIFWGAELTVMYNECYATGIAGRKHPTLMGTGFRGPFKELWSGVSEIFLECRRTGIGRAQVDQMLPLERYGFLEETFFCWSLVPLYGGESTLQGMWNQPFETTRKTLNERRMNTLMIMSEEISLAKTVASFWKLVLKPLEENEFDFPFALLYSVVDDFDGDDVASISSESSHAMKSCILEGTIGIPTGHESVPVRLDLRRARGGFIPAFIDAMRTREPSVLDIQDGTLSEELIQGFEWRGFGEPCKQAVVCPLRPTTGENVLGFLVVGINPRRPYDRDYQTFIRLLVRQLATALASVTLFEAEIRRGTTAAEAAALERLKLSEELAVQRSRLQRMAEVSSVGMFSVDAKGVLLEANDRWFEMTGHSRDSMYEMSWMDVVTDDTLPYMQRGWARLVKDGLPWSGELKLKKPWHDPATGDLVDHWILAASQPEYSSDGIIKSVMGTITDITLQKRSAEDALTRAKLSEELLLRTQEAKENQKNFKQFTDIVPGGLFIMDDAQRITYANTQWLNITGYPEPVGSGAPLSWSTTILEDDLPLFNSRWEKMVTNQKMLTVEVRMRTPLQVDIGGVLHQIQRWIMASAAPEIAEDGTLMSVMGCITDISRIKWAEDLQNRRLIEAEENRRQQNNFIDITSHEMRNPLSAILQCADGISTSLSEYKTARPQLDDSLIDLFKGTIEAADTIQLCAQHQKSIVDDILTISKLDSDLLLITPVPTQPVQIVKQSLKMFVAECQMNQIKMDFQIGESFEKLKVDKVMLDSSRLLQVLINLLTNAIKFTKSESKRQIDVSISVHLSPPEGRNSKFDYFPTNKAKADVTAGSDWGTGEILYLCFEVQDTGCGLSQDEKKLLFTRFSQASPRTHVRYGGSGLGLFISRQLTELQGGEIGVASDSGVGSLFAFYIKSRRADDAESSSDMTNRLATELQKNARPGTDTLQSVVKGETVSAGISYVDAPKDLLASDTPIDPKELHILIVEDNLVNQKILAAQIRKLGSIVYVANHGGEALELLRETKYFRDKGADGKDLSVILMDLEMPVMDGLTCVRKIREMQTDGSIVAHVPIIAVTANARGEQIAAAKDFGMDDVMPKPFRIRQLIPKIDALLQKIRAEQHRRTTV